MRSSITGGFWALILGGASLVAVSVIAGPPEVTAELDAPDVAVATPVLAEPVAEIVEEPAVEATAEPVVEAVVEPAIEAPQATAEPVVTAMAEATVVPDTSTIVSDLALVAPEVEAAPATPSESQSSLTSPLESDELQQPNVPDTPLVDTQPAAQATETTTEPVASPAPAALAPQTTDVAVTQTAQASRSVPTGVQADGGVEAAGRDDGGPTNEASGAEPFEVDPLDDPALEDDTPEGDAPTEATPEDNLSPDAPAILRFAAAFENPEGLPVVAVVLLDDGTLTDGPAQVLQSGIVATVAVNALMEDATLWSEAYREAGAEVAMQVPLPDRATPGDVEVAFAAALEILPQAGMLFSDGTGVLRNDRLAAAQVMQILASEGRGLVTVQQGLGSLVRAAERAEVRVATVSRDIDGAGESNSAILRALDQAGFRARQSGGAIIVARLKPRTMDVLSVWARDAARDGILMGPVSALMVDRSEFLIETPVEGAEEAPTEGGSGLPRISQ